MIWTDEPSRISARDVESLMLFCVKINASDITIQTDENIFVEVHGKLSRISKRRMTPSDMNEIVFALYQSESGLSKINGGYDLDFAYEISPERDRRLRFRVNAKGISVQSHLGIQLTIRTI